MATRLFACRCASISFVTFCRSLGHVPISYAPSFAPSVPRISRASLAFGFRSAYVVLCRLALIHFRGSLPFPFPTSYATRSVHLRRISPRPIRIRPLHTSLCFHAGPIDLVFFKGSYLLRAGHVISRGASRLDAFSAYPFPTWLPSAAPGGTTGTPAVGSSRSSRTKDDSSHISYARGR